MLMWRLGRRFDEGMSLLLLVPIVAIVWSVL